jgi:hypothetical protein
MRRVVVNPSSLGHEKNESGTGVLYFQRHYNVVIVVYILCILTHGINNILAIASMAYCWSILLASMYVCMYVLCIASMYSSTRELLY